MSRTFCSPMGRPALLGVALILIAGASTATAGEHRWRRARRPVVVRPMPTAYKNDPVYGSHLGTFYPTPAVGIVGNYPSGVGYSPLGTFGDTAMSLYGPFSAFRATTAPVATYTRGYDGLVRPAEAISTSNPIFPLLSPVVYPTRANYYYCAARPGESRRGERHQLDRPELSVCFESLSESVPEGSGTVRRVGSAHRFEASTRWAEPTLHYPIPCLGWVIVSPCGARVGFAISHYITVSSPAGGTDGR